MHGWMGKLAENSRRRRQLLGAAAGKARESQQAQPDDDTKRRRLQEGREEVYRESKSLTVSGRELGVDVSVGRYGSVTRNDSRHKSQVGREYPSLKIYSRQY